MKMKCRECQKERKIPERFTNFPLCKNCRKCENDWNCCEEIITTGKFYYIKEEWTSDFTGYHRNIYTCCWQCWHHANSRHEREGQHYQIIKIYDLDNLEEQDNSYEAQVDILRNRVKDLETENERLKKQNEFLLKQLEEVGAKKQVAQVVQRGGKYGKH